MDTLLHTLFEEVVNEDYVIGSYFLVLNRNENPYEKAKSIHAFQDNCGAYNHYNYILLKKEDV